MCDVCGCGDSKIVPVEIHERLMAGNDRTADHNREHLRRQKIVTINLMGSPGAGKTAILEATARAFGTSRRLAAITGDLETERDAVRLRTAGIPAVAITTGTACHLDAEMVHHALHDAALAFGNGHAHPHAAHHHNGHSESDSHPSPVALRSAGSADYLFIENVGNLVCPAIYDLGQEVNVVALSVTEGEDKPLKYPVMFRKADLVLLTKIDLLPALPEFDRDALDDALAHVMPVPRRIAVSARSGDGISKWIRWLELLNEQHPVHGTCSKSMW
ncbi:MAG: hydrogenase nickel incorporation protein HypB [Deltaproteobacteria bacterium]|nr:hydrogenase nickel incorporation protein HypB [Deltaproteobacteria bacterium]